MQQVALVVLRTLIGWHFLYEGYFKLLRPAWRRDGAPLGAMVVGRLLARRHRTIRRRFHALGRPRGSARSTS